MNSINIDKQIKLLEKQKQLNTIKENLKNNCYDTLFFTYEAGYKKIVHFAYLANRGSYGSYAILCMEDKWLHDGRDWEGHKLDMIELVDGEAIFMNWDEAVRNICPKCLRHLSLNSVILESVKALKLKMNEASKRASNTQSILYKQSERLIKLVESPPGVEEKR